MHRAHTRIGFPVSFFRFVEFGEAGRTASIRLGSCQEKIRTRRRWARVPPFGRSRAPQRAASVVRSDLLEISEPRLDLIARDGSLLGYARRMLFRRGLVLTSGRVLGAKSQPCEALCLSFGEEPETAPASRGRSVLADVRAAEAEGGIELRASAEGRTRTEAADVELHPGRAYHRHHRHHRHGRADA